MSGNFEPTQIWEPCLRLDIFSLLEGLESSKVHGTCPVFCVCNFPLLF